MDLYPDVYSKLALALVSAQMAKQSLVAEFGVGEDLPFTFFAWDDGSLAAIFTCSGDVMKRTVAERLPVVHKIGEVCRRLYGADSVTFVAEGFQSLDPDARFGERLAKEFASNNRNVNECVTVSHVTVNQLFEPDATLVSVPYFYEPGRDVAWGESLAYSKGVGRVLLDSPILAVLALCLKLDVADLSPEEFDAVLEALVKEGVNLQEFEPPDYNIE